MNQVHYQAMNKANETMNRIMEEEEKKIAEIRKMKPPPAYFSPQKPTSGVSNFAKLKLKNRKVIKISKKWKANKIPRPVWGIIFEYCDNLVLAKMERVCKSFFLLINPLCDCTEIKGDPLCKSVWMSSVNQDIKERYPDGNCSYFRRVALREKMTDLFMRSLESIKESACKKGTHDWEVNPTNTNFYRCPSCFKGAKKTEFCDDVCTEHKKICQNEVSKFSICRKHACIICRFPNLISSCRIVSFIKEACASYVVYPTVKLTFKENLD